MLRKNFVTIGTVLVTVTKVDRRLLDTHSILGKVVD